MTDRIENLKLLKEQISSMINDMIYEEETSYIVCEKMRDFMHFLTIGFNFELIKLPTNDKTAILLDGLKIHGFVSKDTKLEHFRVLFGIPIHNRYAPFEPIKWRKNKQLLRYFVYELFPKETILNNRYSIVNLFADKHGCDIMLPESDLSRLEQSCDYPVLVDLLKNFND